MDKISVNDFLIIVKEVTDSCADLKRAVGVEEIQDLVEENLLDAGYIEVARRYIRYRYERELIRKSNTTDESILALINQSNEELKQENSNKNPVVNSTQRDYMAGEVSKDLTRRLLLPKDIVEAHDKGLIHIHDMDYFVQHMTNCFSRKEKFITRKGLKSFKDFEDGDVIEVLSLDGKYHNAVVKKYGNQKVYDYTFYCGKKEHQYTVRATENHRWILKSGEETTNLKIGDKLIKAPSIYTQEIKWENLSNEQKLLWCKGFALGDGALENNGVSKIKNTRIRLCGDKNKYKERFNINGCKVRSQEKVTGDSMVVVYDYVKEIPDFNDLDEVFIFLNGLYAADGNNKKTKSGRINFRLQSSKKEVIDFIRRYADSCGLYITKEKELTGEVTNYGTRPYTINFSFNPDFYFSYTVMDKVPAGEEEVWCLEVEDTHNFILQYGIPTGNCCLINLEDMLQNGTMISNTLIETPHSFATACNIATQIIAQVASNQYGGQTISLAHLAPFVDVSRKKIRKSVTQELAEVEMSFEEKKKLIEEITESRVKEEVRRGVQTIQYQINTLMTTNGQAPFLTEFMYLNETKNAQEKDDLALIIQETLLQRKKGVKNRLGQWVAPAFPKLIYVLEEDNIEEGSKYWDLTVLAAECTAKRLVPDYISEKVMKQIKVDEKGEGHCFGAMGCRSFLSPYRDENDKPKYYGRLNCGVVTLNLVDAGLSANGDLDSFWEILEERAELCHKALKIRHNRLIDTPSDVAPILWQHGALARLEPGEKINKYLFNNYSTLSLGYAGLWECVVSLIGKKLTEPEGRELGLKIMKKLNEYTDKWKEAENIGYSIYGSPIESTTYKFAKCLQRRFGIVKNVTDKSYITNSYHVNVTEPIDAFSKLKLESEFQKLSVGGAISYIEIPNMQKNIPAILEVMKFIYNNIMYAELNTKSDVCQVCGFEGEIEMVEDERGKLIWKCPNCGNVDFDKMNVARRVCGYISTNAMNQGRMQEIEERVVHLGME